MLELFAFDFGNCGIYNRIGNWNWEGGEAMGFLYSTFLIYH